jgi:septum site-determining protein MinD
MRGTVFTLAGGKGGVGKTTVAANLATGLVKHDYDVAVVDADLGMTNLDVLLDIDPDIGVHSVLGDEEDVSNATHKQGEGLTIVPGERGIETNGDADPTEFRQVIDPLREEHDIVLIDTGAGVNQQNCIAYGHADAVVLVTTPTEMAVINTKETRELVDRVGGAVAGLVLTRDRENSERPSPNNIAEVLETDLLAAVPEYEEFDPSEPRLIHDPKSPPAQEYGRLATALSVYHDTGSTSDLRKHIRNQPTRERPDSDDADSDDSDRSGLVSRLVSN